MKHNRHKVNIEKVNRQVILPMGQALDELLAGSLNHTTALRAVFFTDVAIDLARATKNQKLEEQANFLVGVLLEAVENNIVDEEAVHQARQCFQNMVMKIKLTPIDKFVSAIRTSEIRLKIKQIAEARGERGK